MGKKRIIQQNEKELLEEREKIDAGIKKGANLESSVKRKEGRIYIFSSYNNTIISLTDERGNLLTGASAGSVGFKGAKKSTPFAASKVAEAVAVNAKKIGVDRVEVFIRGIGSGRESALRSLAARGFDIISIRDITPFPHNGCRRPKTRRV